MRDDSSALKKYLTSNERELQMAAAWAAALKLRTEVVPEVIGLLGSTDDAVSTKAVEALKILSTGEDYGKSADQWKAWWERYKKANPANKYAVLADSLDWSTNVGYPGYATAAIDEAFSTWVINTMFAQASTGELSPEEAIKEAEAKCKRIWSKWQQRKMI